MSRAVNDIREADYVIIGGGSAGCVLANRLSEDPATRVLLIEAGGRGTGFWVDMPVGSIKLVGNARTDWIHHTEPDPTIGGRSIIWNAGKMLGGGGGLNGLVYIRGQRSDYDLWEELGCAGWGFGDVLPYFIRGERWEGDGDLEAHGHTGPLSVTHQRLRSPTLEAFIRSAQGLGFKYLNNPANGNIDGVFHTLTNQHRGRRSGPAQSYLAQARRRPNLEILTHTLADRILFDNQRAVGVMAKRGSDTMEIRCGREVIISGGATQSPAILMRSGVGPAPHLRSHGIDIVSDLSGVGQNLMDHPCISMRWLMNLPSFNSRIETKTQLAQEFLKYIFKRDGILTLSMVQALVGARTSPQLVDPDVLLFFSTWIFDTTKPPLYPGKAAIMPLLKEPAAGMLAFVNRPKSRGQIRLRSTEPGDAPIIIPNLLGDDRDVDTLMRAGRLIERLFAATGLAENVIKRLTPPLASHDEWRTFIRSTASVGFHASGTCRMGVDDAAVVDPLLRVRGVESLRVVDASVMPTLTSGNTNAPTMMIAERGSALILNDNGH